MQAVGADAPRRPVPRTRSAQKQFVDVEEHRAPLRRNRSQRVVVGLDERGGAAAHLRRNGEQEDVRAGVPRVPDHDVHRLRREFGPAAAADVQIVRSFHQQHDLRPVRRDLASKTGHGLLRLFAAQRRVDDLDFLREVARLQVTPQQNRIRAARFVPRLPVRFRDPPVRDAVPERQEACHRQPRRSEDGHPEDATVGLPQNVRRAARHLRQADTKGVIRFGRAADLDRRLAAGRQRQFEADGHRLPVERLRPHVGGTGQPQAFDLFFRQRRRCDGGKHRRLRAGGQPHGGGKNDAREDGAEAHEGRGGAGRRERAMA